MPILCRINASDEVEGEQSVQDAAAVAAYLEQEYGVNALHVTRVVHLHDEFMWAPGLVHGGFNGDLVTEIKRAVSVPVIAVGRFTEPQYAELTPAEQKKKVVVVGGGPGGLYAAWLCTLRGHEVTLLEKEKLAERFWL